MGDYQKYLKYKTKYLNLKKELENQQGGGFDITVMQKIPRKILAITNLMNEYKREKDDPINHPDADKLLSDIIGEIEGRKTNNLQGDDPTGLLEHIKYYKKTHPPVDETDDVFKLFKPNIQIIQSIYLNLCHKLGNGSIRNSDYIKEATKLKNICIELYKIIEPNNKTIGIEGECAPKK
jgi:hypothetical protein